MLGEGLKGFLAFHKVRFQKTHSIKELAKQVGTVSKDLEKYLEPGYDYENFAIAHRYPDSRKKPLVEGEVGAAIQFAGEAHSHFKKQIPWEDL